MGRSFAQVSAALFDDENDSFGELTPEVQITEVFLMTREVNLCGRALLRYRFWSRRFTNGDEAELRRRVQVLVDAGRVAVDEESEELLIVDFPVRDGFLSNSKLVAGMARAFDDIDSPRLQAIVVDRLPHGLAIPTSGMAHRYATRTSGQPIDSPSDSPSMGCGRGIDSPEPFNVNRETVNPSSPPPRASGRRRDIDFDAVAIVVAEHGPPDGGLTEEITKRVRSSGRPADFVARLAFWLAETEHVDLHACTVKERARVLGATGQIAGASGDKAEIARRMAHCMATNPRHAAEALASDWSKHAAAPQRRPTRNGVGSSAASRQAEAQDRIDSQLAAMNGAGGVLAIGSGT